MCKDRPYSAGRRDARHKGSVVSGGVKEKRNCSKIELEINLI